MKKNRKQNTYFNLSGNKQITDINSNTDDGKFYIKCLDNNKEYSFKVVKMNIRVVYHGGNDYNGYVQGQLKEERIADVDPFKGIISEDSEMGKKLIHSSVGDIITVGNMRKRYNVLYVPYDRVHLN